MSSNRWTPEARKRQAELIRRWKPWQRSTGPKTEQGKETVAQNAYKGAVRPTLRALARSLRNQEEALHDFRVENER